MSGNMKEILDTLEAVTKTANEVRELLQKSMPPPPPAMNKADDADADDAPPPGAPEGGEMPPPGAEGDVPPSPAPEGGEMPPPGAPEGGEDAFGAELASMSDDELTMLLQALAEEMEKRKGAQSPEGAVPPEGAGAPPPAAAPSPEMDAMKSENLSMKKSIQGLQSEIAELKKSLAKPAPTSRPASMNMPKVQHKVEPIVEHLTKSEVLSHLENLKKSGNRLVDTDLIWKANSARTAEDIAAIYQDAKIKGIEIPNKK